MQRRVMGVVCDLLEAKERPRKRRKSSRRVGRRKRLKVLRRKGRRVPLRIRQLRKRMLKTGSLAASLIGGTARRKKLCRKKEVARSRSDYKRRRKEGTTEEECPALLWPRRLSDFDGLKLHVNPRLAILVVCSSNNYYL